jgi:hypothetical protein
MLKDYFLFLKNNYDIYNDEDIVDMLEVITISLVAIARIQCKHALKKKHTKKLTIMACY